MKIAILSVLVGMIAVGAMLALGAGDQPPKERRQAALDAMKKGNFKDAYNGFARLALDPQDEAISVAGDLTNAMQCLHRLGRVDEIDDFRDKVISAHGKNWRLLAAAAQSFRYGNENYGFIIAGKFHRGNHRGNDGRYVYPAERDRVRALQLMQQALEPAENEQDKSARAGFYLELAEMLLNYRHSGGSWQLQSLSDLTKLPDYDENYLYYNNQQRGAPVDADGNPIYYKTPKSWKEAANDGQRWRWALTQAAEMSPEAANHAALELGVFLQQQFDVQTMAGSIRLGRGADGDDDTVKDESGPFAVSSLGEDETIARLATGTKRFKLPGEFNFIHILQGLADGAKDTWGEQACDHLANLFENRQQYDRAAGYWKQGIQKFGDPHKQRQYRLDQILGNWGEFQPMQTSAATEDVHGYLLFRNGAHINFEATEIDIPKLLGDIKAYIKSAPKNLDWQKLNVDNVGWRLVDQNQKQYLKGNPVAQWEMDLKPRDKHFDRLQKVDMPLKKAGAYLVVGHMKNGNTTRIVVWHADTAIVKKAVNNGSFVYVADATTGAPVGKANVEFFGYETQYVDGRRFEIHTADFAEFTDAEGQLTVSRPKEPNYSWLITATTPDGRFAYLGFSNIWTGQIYDEQYEQRKVFFISDRPVYRPGNDVKFKFWINNAKYDKEDSTSAFAGHAFTVIVNNPKGDKVMEKTFTCDEYGGFNGELSLPKDATLGQYYCHIENKIHLDFGGGSFRVEEYKKPEFEVNVDAPSDPVKLGDKISATIKAKYYFGSPVSKATVKYKVLRSSYEATWYPPAQWDWFYEPGYWWFGRDYLWYPGWNKWGCRRPTPFWYRGGFSRPEIVAENEAPIAADGTVKVEFDTAAAKAIHGDTDHRYEISVEVTDDSRRTIAGHGAVLVARKPFKVYAWVDRGYYMTGDAIEANFHAQTLDSKPVKGDGKLKLLKIAYKDNKPVETEINHWDLNTDDQGSARLQLKADQPGQYRLSYTLTDGKGNSIEGGYVFVVRGQGFDGRDFRFDDIELVADKKEYQAGDTVKIMINTQRADSTVLLFVRPTNGLYLPPKVIHMKGKSAVEEIAVAVKDMPNFFVEALTVSSARVRDETREVVVPPASRVVNVELSAGREEFKPGEKATLKYKLTGTDGKPVKGSAVLSLYDKSVEYISGGSNVGDIKEFFWKWRRSHYPRSESNLYENSGNIAKNNEAAMRLLGVFGGLEVQEESLKEKAAAGEDDALFLKNERGEGKGAGRGLGGMMPMAPAATGAPAKFGSNRGAEGEERRFAIDGLQADKPGQGGARDANADPGAGADVQPTIRKNFADTAFWSALLTAGDDGMGQVEVTLPESLTTWKGRLWTMSTGTRVGEGSVQVVTRKNLIVRLQAPRFFTQTDEIILSANVHNYLKTAKSVKVTLDVAGNVLAALQSEKPFGPHTQTIEVPAGGEKRVDWRVQAMQPGTAIVRMSGVTDEESDAMEMSFPVFVHGMLKTASYSGSLRGNDTTAAVNFEIPAERLPKQSVIEVRYSPSVASAMVDALPYLVDYPYGCTEQTLNRFLPTVITQKILLGMNLDLKAIGAKRVNLNAQEIGNDQKRAADWKRNNAPNLGVAERNPVFDNDTVVAMTKAGLERLTSMQLGDGGWGWFSGFGERSAPHTTAVVVHGLQIAKENDVAIVPGVLERGVEWLKRYQAEEVRRLKNAATKTNPWKMHADELDALVHMVLTDAGVNSGDMGAMKDFLYRDRNEISVYAKAMFALAMFKQKDKEKLDMLAKNISQYVVEDNENQTAYLKLPEGNYWWNWYGSDTEAMAYYLKLLSRIDPKGAVASRMSKYLINNRKHASYWNSTRDTSLVIESLADFIKASGEDKPDMTVTLSLDGKKLKDAHITAENFFSFDNKLVVTGADVTSGKHQLQVARTGSGPLYFNAYVTNFTLESPIKKAGLEIKVERAMYKLVEVDKRVNAEGTRGQVVTQRVEKYERRPITDATTLKSGDLVEIELTIDSKNDYEYILFEDMKAAGFEPVEVRSGYNGNDLNAYMELRDERVCFFAGQLARGKHSVSYRMRAEIPGKFSALPTKASAMYAPELKANSDENKVKIED